MLRNTLEAEYTKSLRQALNNLLDEYKKRIQQTEWKSNSVDTAKILTTTAVIGTIVGTPLPGIGNAIGALGGLFMGGIYLTGQKVKNKRRIKKFNTANLIIGTIPYNAEDKINISGNQLNLLDQAASKVISKRMSLINLLSNPNREQEYISHYLACNMLAAVKYYIKSHSKSQITHDNLMSIMVNGLKDIKSTKAHSRDLSGINGISISLEAIARCDNHITYRRDTSEISESLFLTKNSIFCTKNNEIQLNNKISLSQQQGQYQEKKECKK